jgi:hypothetical protein
MEPENFPEGKIEVHGGGRKTPKDAVMAIKEE